MKGGLNIEKGWMLPNYEDVTAFLNSESVVQKLVKLCEIDPSQQLIQQLHTKFGDEIFSSVGFVRFLQDTSNALRVINLIANTNYSAVADIEANVTPLLENAVALTAALVNSAIRAVLTNNATFALQQLNAVLGTNATSLSDLLTTSLDAVLADQTAFEMLKWPAVVEVLQTNPTWLSKFLWRLAGKDVTTYPGDAQIWQDVTFVDFVKNDKRALMLTTVLPVIVDYILDANAESTLDASPYRLEWLADPGVAAKIFAKASGLDYTVYTTPADLAALTDFDSLTVTALSSSHQTMVADSVMMQTIANSATAMQGVANSATAMQVVANSAIAMQAVANSTTAMQAVADSSIALDAIFASDIAKQAVRASQVAMQTLLDSSVAASKFMNITADELDEWRTSVQFSIIGQYGAVINFNSPPPNVETSGSGYQFDIINGELVITGTLAYWGANYYIPANINYTQKVRILTEVVNLKLESSCSGECNGLGVGIAKDTSFTDTYYRPPNYPAFGVIWRNGGTGYVRYPNISNIYSIGGSFGLSIGEYAKLEVILEPSQTTIWVHLATASYQAATTEFVDAPGVYSYLMVSGGKYTAGEHYHVRNIIAVWL